MDMMDVLEIEREEAKLSVDARNAIRKGFHPRHEIIKLVEEAPTGTICEIHVLHRTGPLIAALEGADFHAETRKSTLRTKGVGAAGRLG